MIPFLALVRKDLKLFFNDRKAVIVGMLVPIVLASFFGYLFGGQKGNAETSKVPVLVIDQDGSDISRGLITQLAGDKNLDVKPSTLDAAREAVRKGKATATIVIPKDFGKDAGHALCSHGRESKPQARRALRPFPQRGTGHGEGHPGRRRDADRQQRNVHRQRRARDSERVPRARGEQFPTPRGRPKGLCAICLAA